MYSTSIDHTNLDPPSDTIEIHAFEGGCYGTSMNEEHKYCMCYLVKAFQLDKHGSIEELEKNVLARNSQEVERILIKEIMSTYLLSPKSSKRIFENLLSKLLSRLLLFSLMIFLNASLSASENFSKSSL